MKKLCIRGLKIFIRGFMKAMKKHVLIMLLSLVALTSNASVNVMCDVIYKNKDGEWSDFYRTRVTFCLGHEINQIRESRNVFAVIWMPDNQHIILKMKGSQAQTQELDMFNIFLLLTMNDMSNWGIDFELYNADIEQEWKIYSKDEIGLLIDHDLGNTQQGRIYDDGTIRNRESGFKIDRVKPQNDPKHLGDIGEIVYKNELSFYVVNVKEGYFAMERKDCYLMKSEVGDKIIGDFTVLNVPKDFYNKTRDVDGYRFVVLGRFENYEDCERFIKTQWP